MEMDKRYTIKLALTSLNLTKKLSQIINSSGGFEVIAAVDTRHPDLLVMELSGDVGKIMKGIESLLKSGKVSDVFLTAESVNPTILMQAMRIGVKEFIAQPFDDMEILDALKRFKERQTVGAVQAGKKNGQIISVFGSKGGVGTTTVAVNLAVSLAKCAGQYSIALLDMNTLFGEIPLFLEMEPKFHWGEITKHIDRLDDTFLSNILTHHRSGVQVLPSPAYLNGHVRPTPEIMDKLLGLMKQMFDFVIIDSGQSTNDSSLKVLQISDTLLLLSILSLPCLTNTNKLLKSLTDLGYMSPDRIKVVLNRYIKKNEISLKDAEASIGTKIFFTIPNEYDATMAAINNGKPLLELAPKSQITKTFLDLAASLSNSKAGEVKKKSMFFGLA
ncbi:MAG: AAA family ATPase [Deltaproteobacteria bacterium]|nr:AAA family ATPase [Deltaproteobacteria bacterium]